MAPRDDVEVESDGDELLDWLWDFPERYDVGVEEAAPPPVMLAGGAGVAAGAGMPEVRKHLRRPGDAAVISSASTGVDRPTVAMDAVDPFEDDEEGTEFIPALAAERRRRRLTTRDMATAAAVLLVVAVGVGVGYKLFAGNGSGTTGPPSKLAISSPTTVPPNLDQGVLAPVTTPSSDTTTTTPATTVAAPPPPAAASVPAIVSTGTTTPAVVGCTSRCTTTTVRTTPPANPPPRTTPPATNPPPTNPPATNPPATNPPPTNPPPTSPPSTWGITTTTNGL
jgi:hypothetical protein